MAANATKAYRNTFSGSVGAGMGSLFNPNGRKYYILEHKVSSKYHRAGESQEIIIDNIELGRDSRCQVRFDERFNTVSRRHAAIVKDGDMWKLVQLSKTNTTFLNGRPVQNEWYLQNGDEIQLSVNGPKMGFIIPAGKKSTVGSIGLTRRLSLFRQQALRPYKRAIAALSACLVLAVGGLGTWNYVLHDDLVEQGKVLAQQIEANLSNKAKADSLSNELIANNKKLNGYEDKIKQMEKEVIAANSAAARANARAAAAIRNIKSIGSVIGGSEALQECAKSTYYCELHIMYKGQPASGASGTAFLLSDGRLVTAQHVVNPYYGLSKNTAKLFAMMAQEPQSISCVFVAISPTGDKIVKEFGLSSIPFKMPYSLEPAGTVSMQGMNIPVKKAVFSSENDWAYINTGKGGGLDFDNPKSRTLPIKTHLDILGFPQGVGAENPSKISPIFSESSVARDGLDVDGCILCSNAETDHGNSGGPVFATLDGKLKVIGILSGANVLGSKTNPEDISDNPLDWKWKGRVVPIGNTK